MSKFSWRINDWFNGLSQVQSDLLFQYAEMLYNFNQSLNLISRFTEAELDRIHIADSLIAGKRILANCPPGEKIFDIGSGNGLPGVVIGILDPNRPIVLVERDQRKVDFLRIVVSRLGLKNVSIYPGPVENVEKGSIKCAVSRGFSAIALALVKVRPICAPGCLYFHMKGENWARELAQAPSQVFTHWKVEVDMAYDLPDSGDHGPMFLILSRMR